MGFLPRKLFVKIGLSIQSRSSKNGVGLKKNSMSFFRDSFLKTGYP